MELTVHLIYVIITRVNCNIVKKKNMMIILESSSSKFWVTILIILTLLIAQKEGPVSISEHQSQAPDTCQALTIKISWMRTFIELQEAELTINLLSFQQATVWQYVFLQPTTSLNWKLLNWKLLNSDSCNNMCFCNRPHPWIWNY
jgi:ABC-type polar amino acid transport system ATPase subunit